MGVPLVSLGDELPEMVRVTMTRDFLRDSLDVISCHLRRRRRHLRSRRRGARAFDSETEKLCCSRNMRQENAEGK